MHHRLRCLADIRGGPSEGHRMLHMSVRSYQHIEEHHT